MPDGEDSFDEAKIPLELQNRILGTPLRTIWPFTTVGPTDEEKEASGQKRRHVSKNGVTIAPLSFRGKSLAISTVLIQ